MASICNRFISRTSLTSLKSPIKTPKLQTPPSTTTTTFTSPLRRLPSFATRFLIWGFNLIISSPSELGCVQSLLPLHSAVAAARMTSCLSSNSTSCRSLTQGSLCCTSPGL
ncbi:hypothetical protein GIB67_017672 [Kingdonia uniflora]|uniref:Uncharacterized protein n=1 Tax=Kingdonia uniflora TaxID=39325 RepID=A0A7J7NB52_9MAGN|nr:hypothetical protein GIB67_017672 [Kingdonia uniflora]